MKIKYKTRNLKANLILGLIWLGWFLVIIFIKEDPHWADYGWGIMSIMYLGLYFYQKQNQYLIIENGFIKYNKPFGSKLNLTDIKKIKNFAGDYILKTEKKDFTINTQIIDPDSLIKLNTELKKLEVDWT